MRRALVASLLLTVGEVGTQAAPPPPPPPRLVVVVVVDQMGADYFARFGHQLTGGFGRFWKDGAVFVEAYQDHAVTETAPGHSTILSGRHPYSTGIVSNAHGARDDDSPLVGGGGPGASPQRFHGSTLVDWLTRERPASHVLSVSRKDRGAILPIGRSRQHVYWYAHDGRFTTSTYYADQLPRWVDEFNGRRMAHSFAGREWDLLLPQTAYREPDARKAEDRRGAYTFPHLLPEDTADAVREIVGTPWMDRITIEFALHGARALSLGADAEPDLLVVSLSSTDAIGHKWGPGSPEIHDQILRLDRYLDYFVRSIFAMRDSATIAFVLTSDHGVTPFPEETDSWRNAPGYVDIEEHIAGVRRRLQGKDAEGALAFEEGMVYVDRARLRESAVDADSLVQALRAELRQIPGVLRVDDVRSIQRADTATDKFARRWRHMLQAGGEVELMVTLEPYVYLGRSRTAVHGTPHDNDAHVPLIFYGPWFPAGTHLGRVSTVDIAPTLAEILGIEPRVPLDGRSLSRSFRRPGRAGSVQSE